MYDVYGDVYERISDTYQKDYYSVSPVDDPTRPMQGIKSRFDYRVVVPRAGKYVMTARMVTVNYDQRLNVNITTTSSNDGEVIVMKMPFTNGRRQASIPITVSLINGENNLNIWRDCPPQYGLAIESFMLILVT